MSSSGIHWRLQLVPYYSSGYKKYDGMEVLEESCFENALHTSGSSGNEYFGWRDAVNCNVSELAELIKERFPRLLALSLGKNYKYAGWFVDMLGKAEAGELPLSDVNSDAFISTTGKSAIPSPPLAERFELNGRHFYFVEGRHLNPDDDWHTKYIDIINGFRIAKIAAFPAYPVDSKSIFEIGAYWEGAIYYISAILGYRNIHEFVTDADNPPPSSERWSTFFAIWNSEGQYEFLKAFLVKKMMGYPECKLSDDDPMQHWLRFLEEFESSLTTITSRTYRTHNPYFGGSNPLHLGLILSHLEPERRLI
ncbi:hypothetical protein DXV75_01200 [Alteromonas aestuariivivens]|uniref:Uncharacterized protein n=2 Tax=Alteromonas aestuariivivens TaxID=1938339 RepID=A0A3D8ME19_9ALTE|nr:hypothetical protein DXV75_01200 [Alteromonas aestuariivivens]